jgi:Type IV secretion system proteins
MKTLRTIVSIAVLTAELGAARAQVPVIDNATLTQATTTASNTAQIMASNQQILTATNATLAAVTGARQTGSLASAAIGSGFSMTSAPSMGSLLGGSSMSWGNLGSFGTAAATIINGLNLVNTLSGNATPLTGTDQAYVGAVNTAAALMGIVQGAQSAATSRTTALTGAGALVGTAPDIKGSIDQNSQAQIQTALTINEVIGAINSTNAALNAQQLQELAGQAKAIQVMNPN